MVAAFILQPFVYVRDSASTTLTAFLDHKKGVSCRTLAHQEMCRLSTSRVVIPRHFPPEDFSKNFARNKSATLRGPVFVICRLVSSESIERFPAVPALRPFSVANG